ncbi:MAG: DUF4870 domain-containing protein [Candidatus Beckwithbacteria bacterium]
MVTKVVSKKIAFGLEEKVACSLTYVLGWITGLVFLLAEKENAKVRFHAMQSLMFFAAMTIISFVPVVGWLLSPVVMILAFIVWLMAIYKAYNGEDFELPIVGKLAKSQLAKMK